MCRWEKAWQLGGGGGGSGEPALREVLVLHFLETSFFVSERGRGQGNVDGLSLMHTPVGEHTPSSACALTEKGTRNLRVHGTVLQPSQPPGRGLRGWSGFRRRGQRGISKVC